MIYPGFRVVDYFGVRFPFIHIDTRLGDADVKEEEVPNWIGHSGPDILQLQLFCQMHMSFGK
jgi:hypothetical protein